MSRQRQRALAEVVALVRVLCGSWLTRGELARLARMSTRKVDQVLADLAELGLAPDEKSHPKTEGRLLRMNRGKAAAWFTSDMLPDVRAGCYDARTAETREPTTPGPDPTLDGTEPAPGDADDTEGR